MIYNVINHISDAGMRDEAAKMYAAAPEEEDAVAVEDQPISEDIILSEALHHG